MKADLSISFGGGLKSVSILKSQIEKRAEEFIQKTLPKQIEDAITNNVNPQLEVVKKLLQGLGLSHLEMQWTGRNGAISIAVKPKGSKKEIDVTQNDKMICVSSDVLATLEGLVRAKRDTKASSAKEASSPLDFSCRAPQGQCCTSSCS
ncbi:hypothetical protein OESDEN_16079, partial [Oesophagostomum dentatum]